MQVALANVARGFGLVVGSQQLAEWVDWAFSQVPPDSGRVTLPGADEPSGYRPAPRPGSSLSIEVRRASARSLEETPPPETPPPDALPPETLPLDTPPPERARPSRRSRPPSDYDETLPLERIELSRRDIEILTPSPVLEPPPALPAPVPRSSRTHGAVAAAPPRIAEASGSPPPTPRARTADAFASSSPLPQPVPDALHPSLPSPRFTAMAPLPAHTSRVHAALAPPAAPPPHRLDGLPVLPDIASSRELEAMPGLRRMPSSRELGVPRAPTLPAPAEPAARPAGKTRPARSTQKTHPQARPARAAAARTGPAPRRRRHVVWLILLMFALGAGAMAAAYYLPDL
jgi:hypothetical protein